ncbi:hypothetical protein B0T24DRAFT_644220 [Lasiosphaeria ovina]|uniref:FAD-binding PCMH-type domain-containing protein n=1 Tax=Lasiosphaeria ovina TaxID=92902 RepID=A0AAE0MXC7_9PEZI|nr:hypothetical protein B0T24DRAFT_644220 [Lasiosphaeria ovina]
MARFSVSSLFRLSALVTAVATVDAGVTQLAKNATVTCGLIAGQISSASEIIYPISALSFADDTHHWFLSSSQTSACVLEVGSARDLSTALKVIGNTRTPFAVMSGGHASNPGFSSTPGVHISLKRLDQLILSADKKTVELGFGRTWADTYNELEGTGVNVVGGRVAGPGVGGFSLGGGFSWKTNQYGLTCDTIKRHNIVLPNGTITYASADHNRDLFFALKGGMNRFGVVTSAVFATHPQPPKVYGGLVVYPPTAVQQVLNATAQFYQQNKDPKAVIITTLEAGTAGPTPLVLFFHDGPDKPAAFQLFDGIVPLLDTRQQQSFSALISSVPTGVAEVRNPRGAFHTFSTSGLTPRFLAAIHNETVDIAAVQAAHGGVVASYDIEPFTPYGSKATDSAYPHASSPLPLNLYFSWSLPSQDEWWYARMRQSVATLKRVAAEEGIYSAGASLVAYPNYALAGSAPAELYGAANAARLRQIRGRIDPARVMDLAGGWAI